MIISWSRYPILLLFVYSVTSADVDKKKSESQEQLHIDGTDYNLNHPTYAPDYGAISDTIIYKDYERKETRKNQSISDEILKNKVKYEEVTKEIRNTDKSDAINKGLKTKVRSINLNTTINNENSEVELSDVAEFSSDSNRKRGQRRRLLKKIKVDKIENKDIRDEITTTTVLQKEFKGYTTKKSVSQTPVNKPQTTTPRTQKRTRTRAPVVPIIESENYVYSHRGNFHYSYEGGDGTRVFERGEMKKSQFSDTMGEAVVGSYSYTDKDGNDFSLSYTADENGYRPIGAHLPTPPPIPPAIQAALRLLATKTTPEPITERVTKYY